MSFRLGCLGICIPDGLGGTVCNLTIRYIKVRIETNVSQSILTGEETQASEMAATTYDMRAFGDFGWDFVNAGEYHDIENLKSFIR